MCADLDAQHADQGPVVHERESAAGLDAVRAAYRHLLTASGDVTTETLPADGRPFYPAESYHQQYLHKNPTGYCGTGVNACTSMADGTCPGAPGRRLTLVADRQPSRERPVEPLSSLSRERLSACCDGGYGLLRGY
ncbi:peptide-methionine (S)-S-oxide reductase [Streptomyces sp. TRM70308]|uniref:peptide-methionine (S)-S-oxide reductase n=1 Tax=Streptomyces sp. TRM70308 TaxID=3131932 RepID=UPI003D0864CF